MSEAREIVLACRSPAGPAGPMSSEYVAEVHEASRAASGGENPASTGDPVLLLAGVEQDEGRVGE